MKKKLLTMLFLAGVTFASFGCQPKNEPVQNTDTKSVSEENLSQNKADTQKSEVVSNDKSSPTQEVELLVYAGAGLKKSMEEIKTKFEEENRNVKINYIYAGSGQLLAQLEQSGKGDVFIVGSKATFEDAAKKDLTTEGFAVAHHTPCIVTAKDNPKKIEGLEDLTREGIRVALGDPEANAIGKTALKIFEKNKIEGVEENVVVKTGTVNDLYMAIESGNADVAIVTKDGAFNNQEKVSIIEIPEDQNVDQIITATTLKTTSHEDIAKKFVDFLQSEEAKTYWENHGFKPVK